MVMDPQSSSISMAWYPFVWSPSSSPWLQRALADNLSAQPPEVILWYLILAWLLNSIGPSQSWVPLPRMVSHLNSVLFHGICPAPFTSSSKLIFARALERFWVVTLKWCYINFIDRQIEPKRPFAVTTLVPVGWLKKKLIPCSRMQHPMCCPDWHWAAEVTKVRGAHWRTQWDTR